MILAVYIILALVAVAVIAYVVVNYIPKKLHWLVSIILLVLIVFMGSKIVSSIMKPIKFAKIKKAKYTKVIHNLKMIKDAEVAYRKNYKHFTADKNALIKFVDSDSIPNIVVTTKIVKVRRGGIDIEKEVREEIIESYTPVKAGFVGRDYKSMFKVPGTNKMFDLKVDSIEKVEGIMSSVFLAQVDKADVLKGMDAYLIAEEKESIGGTQVRGKFISVGSLEDVKVNGNWPPIYDGRKKD